MDLSKLSADLPLSQSVGDAEMAALNKELSEEFKVGARSIAALYRLSNAKTQMVHARGYLDCINDILGLIDDPKTNMDEVKGLLNAKRAELTGIKTENVTPTQFENGEFTLNNPSQFHFPMTQTPISINPQLKHPPKSYSPKQHQNAKKQHQQPQPPKSDIESDDETEMEQVLMDSGLESLKRKFLNDNSNVKKQKYDELC